MRETPVQMPSQNHLPVHRKRNNKHPVNNNANPNNNEILFSQTESAKIKMLVAGLPWWSSG